MAKTFTGRKRIRKKFGSIAEVAGKCPTSSKFKKDRMMNF